MDTESENSDKDYTSDDSLNSLPCNQTSREEETMVNIKTKQYQCLIIGDMGVGKTSLLASHATGKFPGEHVPTVFGNYIAPTETHSSDEGITRIDIEYLDTTSQDDYDQNRVMAYSTCDIIMVCFSIGSYATLDSIINKWLPEMEKHAPKTPFIIVGNKMDLRESFNGRPYSSRENIYIFDSQTLTHERGVTQEEGADVAVLTGAATYLECSARMNEGISQIFHKIKDILTEQQTSIKKRKSSKKRSVKEGLTSLFCGLRQQ